MNIYFSRCSVRLCLCLVSFHLNPFGIYYGTATRQKRFFSSLFTQFIGEYVCVYVAMLYARVDRIIENELYTIARCAE